MAKAKILLIDSNNLLGETAVRILTRNGYQAVNCCCLPAVGTMIKDYKPDIIILEADTPKKEIVLFIKILKTLYSIKKVLVISGGDNKEELIKAGADIWIRKPFDVNLLLQELELLSSDRAYPL